jgi:putative iron-regulated protein
MKVIINIKRRDLDAEQKNMKVIFNIVDRLGTSLGVSLFGALSLGLAGCGPSETGGEADPAPVVEHYASMVHHNYEDAIGGVVALKGKIDEFVAAPGEKGLKDARQAWLAARPAYGYSEVYRFYGGPIDDEDGPEGQINAWPLDEAFIDYVEGDDDAGIINHPADFATIDDKLLISQNEKGGEKNIATGYHAIEFLLWGQDKSSDGPGTRPYTDYVTGGAGTAQNQDRRAKYLTVVTDLLLEDLESVELQWEENEAYAAELVKDPQGALSKILIGMGSLSGAELSRERMNNALQEQDQEEEHSCFSDNTHADLVANATAVENVYLGRYGEEDGPGIDDLVKAKDADLDGRMKQDLSAAVAAVKAIPEPFDQASVSDDGRAKIEAAIDALEKVTADVVEIATALGVTINLEE